MDQAALYDDDIYAWSQHQAKLLRGLAGVASAKLPNDLDLDHVAEEIEAVGNEQRFGVESNLLQALIHLIKMVALPEDRAVRHWTKEARACLLTARRRYRPSMRRAIDLAEVWSYASRAATRDLAVDGDAAPPLPGVWPFTLEILLDRDAEPTALVAALQSAKP